MDRALNLPLGPRIAAQWVKIADTLDFVITHGPSVEISGLIPRGEHVCCADPAAHNAIVKLQVHLYHASCFLAEDGITYINASLCDGAYEPVNPVRVVDI